MSAVLSQAILQRFQSTGTFGGSGGGGKKVSQLKLYTLRLFLSFYAGIRPKDLGSTGSICISKLGPTFGAQIAL